MAESLSSLQLALLAQKAADQRRLLLAEPIAVVGVGCRFPGANNPDAYWDLLTQGRDAVREVPANRWPLDQYYDPIPGTPGKMHCRHGGFLEQVDAFDPASFGLSPREAAAMDPQHRLMLEVATEALESAGLAPVGLRGSRVGVYVGICTGDYAWRQLRQGGEGGDADGRLDMYFATGTSFSMAPGRLAYALGLEGPALAVDTACSSSLVAVDLACRSLRDRSTDMALAGGVSLLLSPVNSLCFARSGMMASDGRCKTFDAAADGYVRGEGCGVVALKRLADAVAAGDPIWAVLRGSGVNQDGASAGLTVPNGQAQANLMRRTLEEAQLNGDAVDVLEAHGTGTPLGDPIELKALAPVYGRAERPTPLLLGSVKTNLGHLEGAAGVAGLIKAVLMVQRGQVPPHLHLRQPTPFVSWQQWALRIPTQLSPWPQTGRPRRAAVSSFGFSGTNAHVILEQAPDEACLPWPPLADGCDWLLLSARTPAALEQLEDAMATWLEEQPAQAWAAICATSRVARSSQSCRLALAAPTALAAAALLRAGEGRRGMVPGRELRLAWQLTSTTTAAAAEVSLQQWQALGVVPTALVGDPAAALLGDPPRWRRIDPNQAEQQLAEHGYGFCLPLQPPSLEQAVTLWLAGGSLAWEGFSPPAPWPRQVLPVTPFDRSPCWVDEQQKQPGPSPLDHRWGWQPLVAELPAVWPGELPAICCASGGAAALDSLAFSSLESNQTGLTQPDDLLVRVPAALLRVEPALDQSFWSHWLPLLQALLRLPHRVNWALEADSDCAGPQAQAIAALLRTWLREAGSQAGGLLWTGPGGCHQQVLLEAGRPAAGAEWRWQTAAQAPERASLLPASGLLGMSPAIQPVATYLITGGAGALGLATAQWLAERGARHLVMVGRRPASVAQLESIAALEAMGGAVTYRALDLADAAALQGLLEEIAAMGRPLRGIVHAAGILDDGLVSNQTPERCAAVAMAKLAGALQLDRLSRQWAPALDFFVTYSSVAALLGSPGQASYAAANGALDGLMAARRAEGLPGLSLNWGPWAGPGMAARSSQVLAAIPPDQALAALGRWLASGEARGVVVNLDGAREHRLAPLCRALAAALEGLDDAAARQLAVESTLAQLLAELGDFAAEDLDPQASLVGLGLDSLMAVELATAVQLGLGVSLGLGALEGEPTLASLAAHLLTLLADPMASASSRLDLGREAILPTPITTRLATSLAAGIAPGRPLAAEGAILLTGATGFLGAHLLADQLQRHPQLSVFCLVRAEGAGAAKARVRANLQHYGLWREADAARIIGLPGDLARPRLGLDEATAASLTEQLGGILHNGAQLSYVAPYGQLRGANVGGTLAVLELASAAAIPLQFISSTSVYEAAAYRGQIIAETDALPAWQGIHLGYSQTKWVSEQLVLAAAAQGLPVTVYRPPLVGGHSCTGVWHDGDFLHRLVRGCLALGLAPDLAMDLDLVPVDYVAASVGALAWRPEPLGFQVHLQHPQPVLWADLLGGLISRGAPLEAVPLDRWLMELARQPANPLYPLQPFFTHRWGSEQLTYPELNAPGIKARPNCSRTVEILAELGVVCPPFEALIGPYARAFLA
jgi:thioester reductase-like protein